MMTKKGSTEIVIFMTPEAGVLMLGHGHISHYSEYVLSSTLSIYSTLIGAVDIQFHCLFSICIWMGYCWNGVKHKKNPPQSINRLYCLNNFDIHTCGWCRWFCMGLLHVQHVLCLLQLRFKHIRPHTCKTVCLKSDSRHFSPDELFSRNINDLYSLVTT